MPASDFEFRHRTWLISGIFFIGLACYWIDPRNSGELLARVLRSHIAFLQAHSLRSSVRGLFVIGSLVVATGTMIRVWGGAYLRAVVVHDSKVRAESLVADGPFRYTRNPLYFGALLAVFGAGLLFSRTGWILLMSLAIVFCYRLILREERELSREQGERFLRIAAPYHDCFLQLSRICKLQGQDRTGGSHLQGRRSGGGSSWRSLPMHFGSASTLRFGWLSPRLVFS